MLQARRDSHKCMLRCPFPPAVGCLKDVVGAASRGGSVGRQWQRLSADVKVDRNVGQVQRRQLCQQQRDNLLLHGLCKGRGLAARQQIGQLGAGQSSHAAVRPRPLAKRLPKEGAGLFALHLKAACQGPLQRLCQDHGHEALLRVLRQPPEPAHVGAGEAHIEPPLLRLAATVGLFHRHDDGLCGGLHGVLEVPYNVSRERKLRLWQLIHGVLGSDWEQVGAIGGGG